MVITTENCLISLSQASGTLYAQYIYSGTNTIVIPNAFIQFYKDGDLITTRMTDSNGTCSVSASAGTWVAKAIDYDGTVLLESNPYIIEG